ncbi:phage infection protein [Erysipelothrix anatis]|uniref:phage infection protein n=1 Tax=Erysipelothrix anatis TaxID=2683713 RepID=UPI001409E2F5|nr:phage infection protein [Erysipelothrix anatis]
MLKIEKFDNVYGIKKLINPELIEKNTLIYAPNGVMKSSFRDGFIDLKKGVNPKDLFNDLEADVIIEYDGEKYDSTSGKKLNVVVFDSELTSNDIFSIPDIAKLVMSSELRKKYLNEIEKVKKHTSRILELYSSNVTEEKRGLVNTESLIRSIYPGKDIVESISNLALRFEKDELELEKYKKLVFNDINNDNVQSLFSDSQFAEKCNLYLEKVNKKIDEYIFKEGFGIEELVSINKSLKTNKFFDAGHKLILNDIEYKGEDVDLLIEKTIKELYEDSEVESQFANIKKALNKNKDTKKLLSVIQDDKTIINDFSDPKLLRDRIIYSKLFDYNEEITEIKKALNESKIEINNIIDEANTESTIWDGVIEIFNNRFWSGAFDVSIADRSEALIGRVLPTFKFTVKDTDIPINDDVFARFSSGEKRSIFILNMIFQIEIMKSNNKPFIILLDDVADSFDYKNKYAIIEYIRELQSNDLIQLIILTHNYDFFRSVSISCNNLKSKILAYKDENGVELHNANNAQLVGYSYFNNWKNEKKIDSLIALIPLARNMVQLESNASDPDYIKTTEYLHYIDSSDQLLLDDLDNLYLRYNIKKKPEHINLGYIATLKSVAIDIINSNKLKETSIKEKLLLGIFLRVFSEKYLYDSYELYTGVKPSITFGSDYSTKLYDGIKEKLPSNELKVIESSRVIAPSFIHVNSFMYEPLIDVGTERLRLVANELINIVDQRVDS